VKGLTDTSGATDPTAVTDAAGAMGATGTAGIARTGVSQSGSRATLAVRAAIVFIFLAIEKSLLDFLVDSPAAQAAQGLGAAVRNTQHWGFRFAVTFAACLALLAYVRGDAPVRRIDLETRAIPLRGRWGLAHVLLALPLVPLSYSLYGSRGLDLPFADLLALWLLFALAASAALFACMAPWALWRRAGESLGVTWLYASLAAAGGVLAMAWSQMLWSPTARITFVLVRHVLEPVIPTLQADPSTRVLGTPRFAVQIADVCSGLEGVGLMLAFCAVWLLSFRREYVFPRALILLPVGVVLSFALNVVRIAALVLIGQFGQPEVAIYGFHSQAGWIAFNCAAGGLAFVSRRSRWLNRAARQEVDPEAPQAAQRFENPTAVYLLPLLGLLVAGMISRAVSASFETAYSLRLPVVLAALAYSVPRLTGLDWRFSWRAFATGAAVFTIWLLAARLLLPASGGMPSALAAMSPPLRAGWIAARMATSVLAVPLAEELAYRGFLLRRFLAADFESVRFADVGIWPLFLSALLFGALHGALWAPGIVAGLLYGFLVMRTERLGEAIAAHAVTNALIAATVLAGGQWQLW
jgi:exosortase E/protease (VPEID-CTERM system)